MPASEPPREESSPGFRVTWRAPDVGREQKVHCPRCKGAIGVVGEREVTELACEQCQTVYRATGRAGRSPKVKPTRKQVVIEGEGSLGAVLRGAEPKGWRPGATHCLFAVLLWIALIIVWILLHS